MKLHTPTASVRAVFDAALSIHQRLLRGESLDFAQEHTHLLGLLQAIDEPPAGSLATGVDQPVGLVGSARYALTCWIDELFILESAWATQWNERKMEVSLYARNDRAWLFWQQAQVVLQGDDLDLLLVYYWCVMLGFAGDYRDKPTVLQAWAEDARRRLNILSITEPKLMNWGQLTSVAPLQGMFQLQRAILVNLVGWLTILPMLAAVVTLRYR